MTKTVTQPDMASLDHDVLLENPGRGYVACIDSQHKPITTLNLELQASFNQNRDYSVPESPTVLFCCIAVPYIKGNLE
jgi:hypothetical protein